jgi:hypothetical protein
MLAVDDDWRKSAAFRLACKSAVDIAAKFRCDGGGCVAFIVTPDARAKGVDWGVRRQRA